MTVDSSVHVVYVPVWRIQQLFNEGKFAERAKSGEFRKRMVSDQYANPTKTGMPPGTKTQMVEYIDANDNQIALVHQYRLPDGSIGASGKPDPKKLLIGEYLYLIDFGNV